MSVSAGFWLFRVALAILIASSRKPRGQRVAQRSVVHQARRTQHVRRSGRECARPMFTSCLIWSPLKWLEAFPRNCSIT